jgi:lipid-binding SYLF domain-containing protein
MSKRVMIAVLLVVGLMVLGCHTSGTSTERAQVRNDRDVTTNEVLSHLYDVKPGSRNAVESAVGYAAFSNFGLKLFITGGASGNGVAVNNRTKTKTYMKMVELQAGLGLGIEKYRLVFVFETESALNSFVDKGWELGARATAAARLSDKGGSYEGAWSVGPGVWLYQITEHGLALEIAAKGAKFYKDKGLN